MIKSDVYENLKILGMHLNLKDVPQKEYLEWLSKKICEKFGSMNEFLRSIDYLEENYSKRSYPNFADFKKAYNEMPKKVTKSQKWQIEYANTLGIPAEQLPRHANDLTEAQREKLGLPTKEESRLLFDNIRKVLSGERSHEEAMSVCNTICKPELEEIPF